MSKTGISSPSSKASESLSQSIVKERFVGVSVAGGLAEKTAVTVIESFVDHNRVFLSKLETKIPNEEKLSADAKLYEFLNRYKQNGAKYFFDVPLSLPKCMRCDLPCPGYEHCGEAEIVWLRKYNMKQNSKRKPKKQFTPYTQRCVDAYMATELDSNFEVSHALGANLAPLTARAHFLLRRLQVTGFEVNPKINIWRIGLNLKIIRSKLKWHRHAVSGKEDRKFFLNVLIDKTGLFVYQQDLKNLVENPNAFDSFICAYTGYLASLNKTEPRPLAFPQGEAWVSIPKLTST